MAKEEDAGLRANVTPIPIKFKAPPCDDAPMLKVVNWDGKCNHRYAMRDDRMVHASYQIREGETEVECSLCKPGSIRCSCCVRWRPKRCSGIARAPDTSTR